MTSDNVIFRHVSIKHLHNLNIQNIRPRQSIKNNSIQFLRLIQYSTLHAVEGNEKGAILNIYKQMRMTRKILRFLRTLEYSTRMRVQGPQFISALTEKKDFDFGLFVSFLQNLFGLLYFLSDHRVCLAELNVISKETGALHYPRSMKFYFIQNLLGVIKNIISIANTVMESRKSNNSEKKDKITIKKSAFDLIKCLFDCIVALFYWKGQLPAQKIGTLGVITSIMSIIQILER